MQAATEVVQHLVRGAVHQKKMVEQIIEGTTCRPDKQKVTCKLPRTKSCLWCAASAARLPWLRLGAAITILKGPGGKFCSKGLHVVLGQQVIVFETASGHSAACCLPARGWQAAPSGCVVPEPEAVSAIEAHQGSNIRWCSNETYVDAACTYASAATWAGHMDAPAPCCSRS